MEAETNKDIGILVQDDMNFNKGTTKGKKMLDYSLSMFGAGRSILVDKNNRIIAGNKTTKSAISSGIKNIRIIETNGEELIAVKRTDVDLNTKKGREFALADNITSGVNFDIDMDKVKEAMEKVEMHPEVWNVRLQNEEKLDRFGEDKLSNTKIDSFVFGQYDIIMSDGESEALTQKVKEYKAIHGNYDGFITTLINEYNERRSKEND